MLLSNTHVFEPRSLSKENLLKVDEFSVTGKTIQLQILDKYILMVLSDCVITEESSFSYISKIHLQGET